MDQSNKPMNTSGRLLSKLIDHQVVKAVTEPFGTVKRSKA